MHCPLNGVIIQKKSFLGTTIESFLKGFSMSIWILAPDTKKLCDKCFNLAEARGLRCPFMKWDGRFCEQITKISEIESKILREIDNAPLTGRTDFSVLYMELKKEKEELSLTNCFRNGSLPKNMPEVL